VLFRVFPQFFLVVVLLFLVDRLNRLEFLPILRYSLIQVFLPLPPLLIQYLIIDHQLRNLLFNVFEVVSMDFLNAGGFGNVQEAEEDVAQLAEREHAWLLESLIFDVVGDVFVTGFEQQALRFFFHR